MPEILTHLFLFLIEAGVYLLLLLSILCVSALLVFTTFSYIVSHLSDAVDSWRTLRHYPTLAQKLSEELRGQIPTLEDLGYVLSRVEDMEGFAGRGLDKHFKDVLKEAQHWVNMLKAKAESA